MNLNNDEITKRVTHTFTKIFIIVIVIFAVFSGSLLGFFMFNLSPIDKKNSDEVAFKLSSGWGQKKTATELKKAGLIRNELVFVLYSKMINKNTYLAGTYSFNKSMSVDDIINSINNGDNVVRDSVVITFVEGRRFTEYAKVIEEKMGIKADDVIQKCHNKDYLHTLINKYWFLTEDILNDEIYYPLEGYLYPNTYEFNKTDGIEEIIDKLLKEMDTHLSVYKDSINFKEMSVHSLLTLASMVELEAVTSEDRLLVSGIFHNRLQTGMSLGSDVTTYYAEQKRFTDKLYQSELDACNAYNTRGSCVKKLPVSPICSPSYTSIIASINPDKTDYLFFIADKNNKLYYAKTYEEHNKNNDYLVKNNLYPE